MAASPSIATSDGDDDFMRLALQLAQGGQGHVEPNPMVGCVIVRDRRAIGRGFHRKFGGPHAEVDALNSLPSASDAQGATAYVTLEPCCHSGKTPPCTDALIQAGIARVVIALTDPFPSVNGGGVQQLQRAGVETTVGVLRDQAADLNAPYLKRVRTGVPWVIAKWAMSVDGRIATASGQSQWITGPSARRCVHQLRSRVDAIVVGMGTAEADDPILTARLASGQSPPRIATRTVFCRHRLPATSSQLIRSAGQFPLLLVVGPSIDRRALEQLRSLGAGIIETPSADPPEMVSSALSELGRRQMTNVMLEGGSELLASFFAAGEVDECHVYIGPKLIGGRDAPGPVGGTGVRQIDEATQLNLRSVDEINGDLRLVYRRYVA